MMMDKVYSDYTDKRVHEHNGKMCTQKSGYFNESCATLKF